MPDNIFFTVVLRGHFFAVFITDDRFPVFIIPLPDIPADLRVDRNGSVSACIRFYAAYSLFSPLESLEKMHLYVSIEVGGNESDKKSVQ